MAGKKSSEKITSSSTAEYFSKNLQQVGFSSATKAVLTTLKEAVDNSLDACEEAGILPDIEVEIEKKGAGTHKNTDLVRILVSDNGPGLDLEDLPKVFGEYLASSKLGRGRCSRGQQGIGISAATTWAQLTSGKGVRVITKTKRMRAAVSAVIEVDIRQNKGVLKDKKNVDWDRPHGLSCEFLIDGRIQLQGEGGLTTYLTGTALVNPHLALVYKFPEEKPVTIKRVSDECPVIPAATEPHPHTMKLGEFIAHSHLFGKSTVQSWLMKGFSRVSDNILKELVKAGLNKKILSEPVNKLSEESFKGLFKAIQNVQLMNPSTRSVMSIGEEALAKSVERLGAVDFFSVVSRKPTICDAKPVSVEVAIARLKDQPRTDPTQETTVNLIRFANRVPLQFDKSSCAMFKAVSTVNWRAYGLLQPKGSLPLGPYVIATSLVSPFIKFKNASKETVDASDELVEEIRRALIQAGQRLSRHIRKEAREADLEQKLQHIEQFCPILVDCLCRITKAPATRKKKAAEGLMKLLGRDVKDAEKHLESAVSEAKEAEKKGKLRFAKGKKKPVESASEAEVELSEEMAADQEEISEAPEEGDEQKAPKEAKKGKAEKKAEAKKTETKKVKKSTKGKGKEEKEEAEAQ